MDPSVILYHKLIITRFISYKEWGQYPSLLRTIEGTEIQYSYYDYIDAFENILILSEINANPYIYIYIYWLGLSYT